MTLDDNTFEKLFKDCLAQKKQNPLSESQKEVENLVPVAIGVMKSILTDESASLEQKFKAAKTVLDLSGFTADSDCANRANAVSGLLGELSLDQITDLKVTADKILTSLKVKKNPD